MEGNKCEAECNKCYVKYVFSKFFKKLYITNKEFISSKNTQGTFVHSERYQGVPKRAPWALENYLGTPSSLGYRRHSIRNSSTCGKRALKSYLGTRALIAFGYLGIKLLSTRALEGHLHTQALEVPCLVDSP